MLTRRALLAAASLPRLLAQKPGPNKPAIKIAMGVGDLLPDTLRFVKQIGVDWIAAPARLGGEGPYRPLVPPPGRPPGGTPQPWQESEIRRIKEHAEASGLHVGSLPLPACPNAVLGKPERDRDLENARDAIRIAGRVGIPVLEYNFLAVRASAGYYSTEGRGGAAMRAYDYNRVKDQPPFPELGEVSKERMWERLTYFLKALVPAAEEAGVLLAMHPNDPPVAKFRGAEQPVRSIADMRRLIETVPGKANGITLDTGVITEMGGNAAAEIRYFGTRGRIHHVHFRNVQVDTPNEKYLETFIDEGQANLLAAMRAFHETGYSQMIIPDHTPEITGDTKGNYAGWAFSIGYMKALHRAAL